MRRGALAGEVLDLLTRAQRQMLDVGALVEAARAIPGVTDRGVQGVHAEIMRRLMSEGRTEFPDFQQVRQAYSQS